MVMDFQFDVGKAQRDSTDTKVEDVTIDAQHTDGITAGKESSYINANWTKWYGYYKSIPELFQAINMIATWTVGRGATIISSRDETTLDYIHGPGFDSFDDFMFNMVVTMHIGGDAFAEIIKNDKGALRNLKPLDPGTIKIVVDRKGIIKRYEQVEKTGSDSKVIAKFKPNEILHFLNRRTVDNIHGQSDVEILQDVIDFYNEMFVDARKVYHLFGKPLMMWKLKTQDKAKINAFIEMMEGIINKSRFGIYVPEDTVDFELVSTPANATINYSPMINLMRDRFFQVLGIPQVLVGSSGEFTESTAKIAFTAFEQTVRAQQRHIEKMIWNQLYIKLELEPPITLRNELLTDTKKDGANQQIGMNESDLGAVPETQPQTATPIAPQTQQGVMPNAN